MKLRRLRIHNFRSIVDADIEVHDYTMIVGANNAGKSNIISALRAFYEDIKHSGDDIPKMKDVQVDESWVELTFDLTNGEWEGLADKYKEGAANHVLVVRRYFASKEKDRFKSSQSNIYAIINGEPEKDLFYGAKNVGTAKVGNIIYIPALTTAADQMKTSGPSPLRDMLNLMLKRVVADSPAFMEMEGAFGKLNEEARGEEGFLSKISKPINQSIEQWGIRFDMGVSPVAPEDITKNLIRHSFVDAMLGETSFALDRYGHGFQRSFLYELIKLAPSFVEGKTAERKDFDPDFTLVLFEEPEAFLHPAQQENMAYHLRRLGAGATQQVIVTSHSPIFVGKVADDLCQIVRVRRNNGISNAGQIKKNDLSGVLRQGYEFKTWLEAYVNDQAVPDNAKNNAKRLLQGATEDTAIAEQEERFRYQLWLDSERASMFFADRVLLVEGATEKALFAWLLARDWHDLSRHRVAIVDAMGKYNLHRYIALLEGFGIPYGLMLDDDQDKDHHKVVNEMLKTNVGQSRVAEPCFINECMEKFLGLNLPVRDDQKPIHTLKAIEAGGIAQDKLDELRKLFLKSLALEPRQPAAA
ncbi:ATP-dependent nuclease [Luteibacter sp. Lutesp34]|uniref:ATP-dependent nuclease n=1 Tax=Luteibacter sp. Lutesp34 TaxID=3243030 RepID=UPI0039B5F689